MNESPDAHQTAKQWAIDMLRGLQNRTDNDVRTKARLAIQFVETAGAPVPVDEEQLIAELLHIFSITAEHGTALDDFRDHKVWLPGKKATINWRFWSRYMTYLERIFEMPPEVVNNLHELTDMALERLEDPARPGPWDRRGMVVGSVQSGKTANYTGLICKALDAGYKLIIILAGLHSNLRSQTQVRIDEGVLGFDTKKSRKLNQNNHWIGVGTLPGDQLHVHSLTSSEEEGDFRKSVANTIGVMIGGDPVVLVVKKNSSLLKNLLKWVLHVAGTDDVGTAKRLIKNVPLMLIDDEADNASINTKAKKNGDEDDTAQVSAINGRIREILTAFEKSAYVGYTATPFANIFINPSAQNEHHGDDIFPRSFIINVKPPTNYVGPAKVFGLDGDIDADIPASEGLPIVRILRTTLGPHGEPADDFADPACFPPRHKRDLAPERLPASLRQAIRCFILSCAARRARGQGRKHSSMLIHVTRFVDVQGIVANLVRDELLGFQRRLQEGDGRRRPTLREELHDLWNTDFVPTTAVVRDETGKAVSWEQVDAELHAAASKIEIMLINGFAKEALDYKDYEAEGRSVIAIGGDKLSRGLTLEGLSVSYFLRTSRMYDTLMQMGRWFGYRPGYLDLCRLFTTAELVRWYRHIAIAEAELRREFEYMVASGLTPERYGLRVRTHPDGMIVTALNKMCHSERLELSWAGVLVQTAHLPKSHSTIKHNLNKTEEFLHALHAPLQAKDLGSCIWRDVTAEKIEAFVGALWFPPESARASGAQLASFIRTQAAQGELTRWTVALISNTQADIDGQRRIASQEIGLVRRTPESQLADSFALRKANILSPADESIDLKGQILTSAVATELVAKPALALDAEFLQQHVGQDLHRVAVLLTRERVRQNPERWRNKPDTEIPNGRIVRELRPKSNGLLLIYPLAAPAEIPASKGPPAREAEATGLHQSDHPVIGLALSFPTSESAASVEYRVNKVWGTLVQDDAEYDDD